MFQLPEQFRNRRAERETYGSGMMEPGSGVFYFQSAHRHKSGLLCLASTGLGWEHVSVSGHHYQKKYLPSWEEMCQVKDVFWGEEDVVVQFHPRKQDYVNNAQVLHLWRQVGQTFETPPHFLVGLKDVEGMTKKEARVLIDDTRALLERASR